MLVNCCKVKAMLLNQYPQLGKTSLMFKNVAESARLMVFCNLLLKGLNNIFYSLVNCRRHYFWITQAWFMVHKYLFNTNDLCCIKIFAGLSAQKI